ncbi:MAG: DNA repair protein RecN [Chloroflexia bacterium]
MLLELRIRNFAIIEELNLTLSPGLNVLTGETGAGKSIIIDALGLLLGDKAERTLVRSGTTRAEVEGVIALDECTARLLRPLLEEYGLASEEDENLILYRELEAGGRSLGRVNGRAVNVSLLREIGERLVDIHGQSEHLSLFRVRHHLELLDRYAGCESLRQEVAEGVARLRALREEIRRREEEQSRQEERAEVLRFCLQEIASARLRPGEEEELRLERQRLQQGARLLEAVDRLYALLHGGEGRPARLPTGSVQDLLGMASREMEALLKMDPTLAPQRDLLTAIADQVEELLRALRAYRERLDLDPRRLEEVEERLILVRELERKYGPTVEEVLATAERAREELAGLVSGRERLEELRREEEELLHELGRKAGRLSARREEAAGRLSRAVEGALADLNMAGTTFAVRLERATGADGLPVEGDFPFPAGRYAFDAGGIDRVEFLISPNPGEELRPLARIASGGESTRLLLAVKSILSQADATPILIFDEIDVGVGGRSGYVVGEKLRELARTHQVICITHLPQIAAYADAHFSIGKAVRAGRTTTQAVRLEGAARIEELAMMLGGPKVSAAHRESARQILEQARQRQAGQEG